MTTTADIEVNDEDTIRSLAGAGNANLKALEKAFPDASVGMRGHTIHVRGEKAAVETVEGVLRELIAMLADGGSLSVADIGRVAEASVAHPGVKLRDVFDDVVLVTAGKKAIKAKTVAQHQYVEAMRNHDVVFGVGPAGTGKTYLAMAMAVRALKQRQVKRIILTRPAVEAGEKLGFLPGDLAEKVNPYLRPLYDALHDMMDVERVEHLMNRGDIEVAPLAFMRGRTLNAAFVILDEAQNTSVQQMKMFLTRLGFDSKAAITGDASQVDLPDGTRSGLADAIQLLDGVEGIKINRFTDADVVRHPLVRRIIRAYDGRDARKAEERAKRREAAKS